MFYAPRRHRQDPRARAGLQPTRFSFLAFSDRGPLSFSMRTSGRQGVLPLDPQGFPGMTPELSFNTAISFVTNTNWQFYSGESAASPSLADGPIHLCRTSPWPRRGSLSPCGRRGAPSSPTGRRDARALLDRCGPHHPLQTFSPLSIVIALALMALGVPQTLLAHVDATTVWKAPNRPSRSAPSPAREAIKQLSAPMAAASSLPTPLTRSKTPTPFSNLDRDGDREDAGFSPARWPRGHASSAWPKDARALVIAMTITTVLAAAAGIYIADGAA